MAERPKTAMRFKRDRGEFTGGFARYGFRLGSDGVGLEPVAEEQAVLAAARKRRLAGGSLRDVAADLEGQGYLSRAGRRFTAEQVRRMLPP